MTRRKPNFDPMDLPWFRRAHETAKRSLEAQRNYARDEAAIRARVDAEIARRSREDAERAKAVRGEGES